MEFEATHPLEVLRRHATELEAALSVCLADPGHRPVHRLRTETRRMEAQLLLLAQLPGLPPHRREAERMRRSLKRLRRSAGEIRDLDVQRKNLDAIVATAEARQDGAAAEAPKAERRGRRKKTAVEATAEEVNGQVVPAEEDLLRKGATHLGDHLQKRRETAAAKLQTLLHKRQGKAAQSTEALLAVLAPAESFTLPAETLLQHAQTIFLRDGLLEGPPETVETLDEEDLHTLRKAAKAARYVAENLPESPVAAERAARYERLQGEGGVWHDALDLHRAARRFLGKGHALTAAIAAQREAALGRYRTLLQAESRAESPTAEKGQRREARQPKGTARHSPKRKPVAGSRKSPAPKRAQPAA